MDSNMSLDTDKGQSIILEDVHGEANVTKKADEPWTTGDHTEVGGMSWSTLRLKLVDPSFETGVFLKHLSKEDRSLLRKLATDQKKSGDFSPLAGSFETKIHDKKHHNPPPKTAEMEIKIVD